MGAGNSDGKVLGWSYFRVFVAYDVYKCCDT